MTLSCVAAEEVRLEKASAVLNSDDERNGWHRCGLCLLWRGGVTEEVGNEMEVIALHVSQASDDASEWLVFPATVIHH